MACSKKGRRTDPEHVMTTLFSRNAAAICGRPLLF